MSLSHSADALTAAQLPRVGRKQASLRISYKCKRRTVSTVKELAVKETRGDVKGNRYTFPTIIESKILSKNQLQKGRTRNIKQHSN